MPDASDKPANVGSLNPPPSPSPSTPATPPSATTPPSPPTTPTQPPKTPVPTSPVGSLGSTSAETEPILVKRADSPDTAKPIPPILKKDGQDITPKAPTPQVVAQAGATQLKSDGQRLSAETVDVNPQNPSTAAGYVKIEYNPEGKPGAKVRGVCVKCGFQSFQPTELAAQQMIEYHATKHLLGN